MRHVSFVVNELYPLHKGGIGRFVYNMVHHTWPRRVQFSLLLYGYSFEHLNAADLSTLEQTYAGKAKLIFFRDVAARHPVPFSIRSVEAFDEHACESYYHYHFIRQLILEGAITPDCIEFIDHFGPAFFALQSRRGDTVFARTRIGVRLHSTNSIITHHERYQTVQTSWHAKVHDIERKALLDADYVVGHLPAVVEHNAAFYDFPAGWAARARVDFPPVVIDRTVESALPQRVAHEWPVFMFSSRIAPFKQPELFIAAAVLLLDAGVAARFVVASYGWDAEYVRRVKAGVPRRHRAALSFADGLSESERLALLSGAIVVIPSSYESFCFFAYESLLRGQRLILNRACLAFGETDFWRDRHNCLMFDGSAGNLAQTMESAIAWSPQSLEIPPVGTPYWEAFADLPEPHAPPPATPPTLALLSFEPWASANVVSRPEGIDPSLCSIRVYSAGRDAPADIRLKYGWSDALALSDWIAETLTADYVAVSPHRAVIEPEFLRFALQVLASNPDVDGVVPQYRDLNGDLFCGFAGGDLVSAAAMDVGKCVPLGTVLRRDYFQRYSKGLADGDHWYYEMNGRAILSGARFAAAPASGYLIFGRVPDPALNPWIASGVHLALAPLFVARFGRAIAEYRAHNYRTPPKPFPVQVRNWFRKLPDKTRKFARQSGKRLRLALRHRLWAVTQGWRSARLALRHRL